MYDADDIVYAFRHIRAVGKNASCGKAAATLSASAIQRHSFQIDARSQNVSGLVLGELQSAAQQFHLVAVYSAIPHQPSSTRYGEFFLGHCSGASLTRNELGDHLFPQAEYPAPAAQVSPHGKSGRRG